MISSTFPKKRNDLDILKGIGIFFVVLGHIHNGNTGPLLWGELRTFLYTFHMPLFFIVSGYLFALSGGVQKNPKEYVKKSLMKNAIPLITFTLITASYKLLIQYFIGPQYISYPVSINAILQHFLNPLGGFATFLWFLYSLFLIQISYIILHSTFKSDLIILGLFVFLLNFEFPRLFCIDQLIKKMPFYVIGILTFNYGIRPKSKEILLLLSLFMTIMIYYFFYGSQIFIESLLLAVSMTWFLWSVAIYISQIKFNFLTYIGKKSIDIYLWHTLIIGVLGFVIKKCGLSDFWNYTITCFIFSLISCLILSKIIDKFSALKFILYGRK